MNGYAAAACEGKKAHAASAAFALAADIGCAAYKCNSCRRWHTGNTEHQTHRKKRTRTRGFGFRAKMLHFKTSSKRKSGKYHGHAAE